MKVKVNSWAGLPHYECPECDRDYFDRNEMDQHARVVHRQEAEYPVTEAQAEKQAAKAAKADNA